MRGSPYVSKKLKKQFLLHSDPVVRAWDLSNRVADATVEQFFLSSFHLFHSIFSGLIWIDKLHICIKGLVLFNNGSYGNGKRTIFHYHSKGWKQGKMFHQRHESYTFELQLIKLSFLDKHQARKNVASLKRYILRKRGKKLKDIFTFNSYLEELCS